MNLDQDKLVLAKNWFDRQFDRYRTNEFGQLAAIEKTTGNLMGLGGILTRELQGKPEFEITYSLLPSFWGKGYATELATSMKRFGLENGVSDKFISIIHRENEASMNVARKNGMTVLYETEYLEMDVYVFGCIIQ